VKIAIATNNATSAAARRVRESSASSFGSNGGGHHRVRIDFRAELRRIVPLRITAMRYSFPGFQQIAGNHQHGHPARGELADIL